jgi:hypothetical protein
VAGNEPALNFFGSVVDRHRVHDRPAGLTRGPAPPLVPPGSQVGAQLPGQLAPRAQIDPPVDRLVADLHRLIVTELQAQPASDLLG